MRKWVVLTLGVVLAVAGLLSIWQGLGVIEFERGTAAVISGSVLLAGGVITIALHFVLVALERLSLAPAAAEMAAPAPAAAVVEPEAPVQPQKTEAEPEVKLPVAPVLPPLALREEPPVAPFTLEPAKAETPKAEAAEPAPIAPAPLPTPPAPAPVSSPSTAPVVAAAATAAAATGGFFAIRNFFARRADPVKAVELQPEDTSAPKLPDFLVRRDVMPDAPKPDENMREAAEPATLDTVDQAQEEHPEGPSDADKYAWLEKALSGEDEEKPEPEFDWLRNRTNVEPGKEPILDDVTEETAAAPEEEVQEPMDTAAPAPAPAVEPVAPPSIIGRYNSGGAEYTLYSDGSIDAETAEGHLHFASMADLRAHIEAQQNRG